MDYGLIGEHLSHSYSKQIHELLGDYSYEVKSIAPNDLPEFFAKKDFNGINVTIPYKKTVIPFCSIISPIAQRIGSVNTITVGEAGNLCGDNSDYFGFLYMAQNAGITFINKKVLVLGSGGTARTVQAVADDCGAKEIVVVSRTGTVNYSNVCEQKGVDIIVNATPVGMYPETGNSPLELNSFPDCSGVLDVTYNPLFSRLLLQAKQLGIPFANGLTMLAAQAKYSSDLFFHHSTPLDKIDVIVNELTCRFTNIVLIGMPGSGKTTVGKLISDRTKKSFVDTDALIEEKEGMSIPETFEKHGEAYFRNLESETISKFGKEKGQVISTGGGAVLRHENYLNLKQNGFIVFLQRDIKSLESKGRPLSAGVEAIEKLYEKRLPLYRGYCDMEIDGNGTPDSVAEKIIQAYMKINSFKL